jgi:hypothetical protein
MTFSCRFFKRIAIEFIQPAIKRISAFVEESQPSLLLFLANESDFTENSSFTAT